MDSEIINAIQYDEGQVDIEAIMVQIRAYLAQKRGIQAAVSVTRPASTLFDPEVYDELYEATQTADKLYVGPYLTPVNIPIVGSIWQTLRGKLHEIAVFYVNRLSDAQSRFNAHIVHVLDGILRSMDNETPARIQRLESRVAELEQRLKELEQAPAVSKNS